MKKEYNIAIVGVTGLVGGKILQALNDFDIPIKELKLYASKKSIGKQILFRNKYYIVESLSSSSFKDCDYILFATNKDVSSKYVIKASKEGIVIDNSSFFRLDNNVSLIVPEINISKAYNKRVIANPNCVTIHLSTILNIILKSYKIEKVVCSTYQSVSGNGMKGIDDYFSCLEGYKNDFYPCDITKNCYAQIGDIDEFNQSEEENKMIKEIDKILDTHINLYPMCVRVPIVFGHCISLYIEVDTPIDIKVIESMFMNQENIVYNNNLPPLTSSIIDSNKIAVGRIKKTSERSFMLFSASDNVYKGAAGNAVAILNQLILNK